MLNAQWSNGTKINLDSYVYLVPPRCQSKTGNALRESEAPTIAPASQQPTNQKQLTINY
ncbi:MAG: hypothetical protein KME38_23510 [Spirirestis rafaelensis WJT71-NPBG6]|nr:hypothetical protein [Spirirestis rafaelensis WJT71-NPBG6]